MRQHDDIEQGTEKWFFVRKTDVTGTVLKSICGTPKAYEEAKFEMVANRLTVGVDMENENPMERGTRLEPEAIAAFEFETGKTVTRTGYCQSDTNPQIANSPDGLIPAEDAAIEVKCPGGKNYMKIVILNAIPDEYIYQIHQYFIVNEKLKTVYFTAYNPDIPYHPLHIITVTREMFGAEIDASQQKEEVFLQEVNEMLEKVRPFVFN